MEGLPSPEEIQQILDENTHLIKTIMKCQREGRIMDAMLYQTRLQLNLVHLASIADNRPAPTTGPQAVREAVNSSEDTQNSEVTLTKFVRAVRENGLKDIELISRITDISIDKIVPLANAYIAFLKRQNRFAEALQLENDLSLIGAEPPH